MKYLKMLGLAAVAAMGLMAFLGAGTASATVVCTTPNETNACAEAWHEPAGTIWDASLDPGSTAVLEATGGGLEDTCSESTVAGKQENTGSDTETVKVEVPKEIKVTEKVVPGLSFGNCTKPTKVLNPEGTMEFHWISGTDNATVTATGFEVTVEAVGGVSCVYSAGAAPGTDLGTATGGSMGTIDVSAIVNKKSGSFLCPADSVWTASYTITDPSGAVYFSTK
jgi:hypothetical protein